MCLNVEGFSQSYWVSETNCAVVCTELIWFIYFDYTPPHTVHQQPGTLRDREMYDKFILISNNDKQNYIIG